jgi:hypothetical protein
LIFAERNRNYFFKTKMSSSIIALTTVILAATLSTTNAQTCQTDYAACIQPLNPNRGMPAACSETHAAGSYGAALKCGASLMLNGDCNADDAQLFITGGQLALHATCMMDCGKVAACPYDGALYKPAVNKVTGAERDKKCLSELIDCQTKWDACSSSACTCTQGGVACTRVAAAPCPDFAMMGMDVPGLPGQMTFICNKLGKCSSSECDAASSLSASALLAVVASIVVAFF